MYSSVVEILYLVVLVCVIAAWFMAVSMLVQVAKDKGYCKDGAGKLWFVGIFASPIVLGLYVASLPDKSVCIVEETASNPINNLPAV